jgi:hypothetical protein
MSRALHTPPGPHRDPHGAPTLKFAVAAPLVFLALLSLSEVAMLRWTAWRLDRAVSEAARRAPGAASGQLQRRICARLGVSVATCGERLTVRLEPPAPPSGRAVVSATYRWPLLSPFVVTGFTHLLPTDVLLASRAEAT